MSERLKIDLERWQKRLDQARDRRKHYEQLWEEYAKLHVNLHDTWKELNDDDYVTLPGGDQVRVHLVHRNLEQTFAQLDISEISVRATAEEFDREQNFEDTHRESVVETGIDQSLYRSGLFTRAASSESVKRDGAIIGHGINYTFWDVREHTVLRTIPMLREVGDDGQGNTILEQEVDDEGRPKFETEEETATIYEGTGDRHVPVKEFLFSHTAGSVYDSPWHAWERVVPLAELRQDPSLTIPEQLQGAAFKSENLYGDSYDEECEDLSDAVKFIIVYDKDTKLLMKFIEASSTQFDDEGDRETWFNKIKKKLKGTKIVQTILSDRTLIPVSVQQFPVEFDHPDDTPFSFFIPIPANDMPFGISQVEHIRNTAREADKIRTRIANITRQLKRVFWYRKGRVDPNQIAQALKSAHGGSVGIDLPEDESAKDFMGEFQTPPAHQNLYSAHPILEDDVRKTSGVADIPQSGASTATESEHIYQVGSARPKRKSNFYLKFLTEVAYKHKAFLRAFAAPGQRMIVRKASGEPLMLEYGRNAFQGRFRLQVMPGSGAIALSPVEKKTQIELASMLLGSYGPAFDRILLRELLTKFDIRVANDLVNAIQVQAPAGPGGGDAPLSLENANNSGPGQALRAGINQLNEAPRQ